MRYLIIAPRYGETPGEYYEFPLGLAYISSCLKNSGVEVVCLNLNEHDKPQDDLIEETIRAHGVDVVCTGGLSTHYNKAKAIVQRVKNINKNILTIVGGGMVSSEPELIFQNMDVDIGVIGEGEETIVELSETLVNGLEGIQKISGIVYRESCDNIVKTRPRQPISDINRIPLPDYEGFGIQRYLDRQQPNDNYYLYPYDKPRAIPIISSRSCPYQCTFCYHPIGNRYRVRSIDSVFDEIAFLKERFNINMLVILDELFSTDEQRVEQFCQRLASYDIKWIAQMRVDRVNRSRLKQMKASGLYYISYGIESASDTVLKSMKKKIQIKQIESALAITRDEKIGIQGNFIFGDPAETVSTAEETLAWWKAHPYYQINMTPVIPYPGSAIYNYCVDQGIISSRQAFIEQGCPSVNMTKMDDTSYSEIFQKMSAAIYQNRMFGLDPEAVKMGFDNDKKIFLYQLHVTCPHCFERNRYNYFHRNTTGVFKLGCRFCNQRFDLRSTIFKHIREKLSVTSKQLDELQQSKRPVSITPWIQEYQFFDTMEQHHVDFERLNIRYVLDANTQKADLKYLDRYRVLVRQKHIVAEKCKDHIFIVLPAYHSREIARQLRQDFNLPVNRIIRIDNQSA